MKRERAGASASIHWQARGVSGKEVESTIKGVQHCHLVIVANCNQRNCSVSNGLIMLHMQPWK